MGTKNVEEYLSISDLFILPSETESFGLVTGAIAQELSIVSTNSGGLNEVILMVATGYLSSWGCL